MSKPRLLVGAGFAGFHCARELERLLRPSEAGLTLASPVDYMLYSPLLPQVAAGVITPQAAAVSLRRTLRTLCSITGIDLDARACVAQAVTGEVHTVPWDYLMRCPGMKTLAGHPPARPRAGRVGTRERGQRQAAPRRPLCLHGGRAGTPGVETAAVQDLTRAPDAITPPTAQHAQRQAITAARDMARRLRGQPPRPYRHRDLGLAVDLGGTQAVSRPLGRYLSGVPAQVVTRGYHLYALPPPRARVRTAADWLMHTALGDNFARLVLPDPMHGTLAGQEATGQYLSGGDARQTAARILAHDQEGWLT